jgi:hypothetical protein
MTTMTPEDICSLLKNKDKEYIEKILQQVRLQSDHTYNYLCYVDVALSYNDYEIAKLILKHNPNYDLSIALFNAVSNNNLEHVTFIVSNFKDIYTFKYYDSQSPRTLNIDYFIDDEFSEYFKKTFDLNVKLQITQQILHKCFKDNYEKDKNIDNIDNFLTKTIENLNGDYEWSDEMIKYFKNKANLLIDYDARIIV